MGDNDYLSQFHEWWTGSPSTAALDNTSAKSPVVGGVTPNLDLGLAASTTTPQFGVQLNNQSAPRALQPMAPITTPSPKEGWWGSMSGAEKGQFGLGLANLALAVPMLDQQRKRGGVALKAERFNLSEAQKRAAERDALKNALANV